MFQYVVFAVLLLTPICHADQVSPSPDKSVIKQIIDARLVGNYDLADQMAINIETQFPDLGIGYALHLGTINTRLSWDGSDTRWDKPVTETAKKLLALCKQEQPTRLLIARSKLDCGTAHFSLSFIAGLRGNLYQAGTQGSKAIDNFEQALLLNPDLNEAKLPLAMAYYYADNLPSFVKLFSAFLWFIPKGQSDKSLPYLKQVIDNSPLYSDSAKFVYSDMLLRARPEAAPEALLMLSELAAKYPENPRIHLANIAAIIMYDDPKTAKPAINNFFYYCSDEEPVFVFFGKIWQTFAVLGSSEKLEPELSALILGQDPGNLPDWSLDWLTLTQGLILNYSGQRQQASIKFNQVLNSTDSGAEDWISEQARRGLKQTLAEPATTANN
jgi:tetratricopeptide (TPR) repeat protein